MLLQPINKGYGEFKFFAENREINQGNVESIAEGIEHTYLLDLYPIVTDREKVIVDGQHRFTVAKNMILPFYAIASDDVTVEDIARANSNTLAYSVDDARFVYEKLGLKAYERVNHFIRINGLDEGSRLSKRTGSVIKWLDPNCNKATFVSGDFVVRKPEYAQAIADTIKDYAKVQSFFERSKYSEVIQNLLLNPLYDHARMMRNLEKIPTRLKKVATRDEGFKVLTDIYNYGIKHENRVKLVYLEKSAQVDRFDKHSATIDDGGIKIERGMVSRPVKIMSSTDYSSFSLHPCRRSVSPKELERLRASILTKNLLNCYPIICDSRLTIIDGQRRFLVAKELGLPIYYIESSSVTLPMVISASASSKSWASKDYLHHFCSVGKENYLKLASFISKYEFLDLQTAYRFVDEPFAYSFNDLKHRFKTGQLDIGNYSVALRTAISLSQLEDRKLRNSRMFQFALCRAIKYHGQSCFNPDVFVEQANSYPDKMAGFVDKDSCMACIEETYNHQNRGQKFFFSQTERQSVTGPVLATGAD